MRFRKIILVGSGKIACDCLKEILKYDVEFRALETGKSHLSMLKSYAHKESVIYCCLNESKKILEYLQGELEDKKETLIVSANNDYLFPEDIVKKAEIINFHYSYLPDYRGVNIPTWVIFNGEKETGVTWHYVNDNIDDGNIIVQQKILIKDNTTAFDITQIGMQIGKKLFESFFPEFLERKIEGKNNIQPTGGHCYQKKQRPNGGYLDIINLQEKGIWNLLRAYDYRGADVIEPLKMELADGVHEVKKYKRNISQEEIADMDYVFEKEGVCFGLKFRERKE